MSKTAIFLADGYEEIEALTVVDLLRRANLPIDTVSISNDYMTHGSHNMCTKADKLLSEIDFNDYDMLVLPGGMKGTNNLESCEPLMKQFEAFYRAEKYIAAICAAPSIFGHKGYVNGRKAVVYPGFEDEMTGADMQDATAVRDGHVITGRSMGGAIDFSLLIIETLSGKEEAEKIAKQIVYRQ